MRLCLRIDAVGRGITVALCGSLLSFIGAALSAAQDSDSKAGEEGGKAPAPLVKPGGASLSFGAAVPADVDTIRSTSGDWPSWSKASRRMAAGRG